MRARVAELPRAEQSQPTAGASAVLLRHWDDAQREVNAGESGGRDAEPIREDTDARRVRFAYD